MKKIQTDIPQKPILFIEFWREENYKDVIYNEKVYTIIAGDDVGNLIGIDDKGNTFYIDTEYKTMRYMADTAETLIKQLLYYEKSCNNETYRNISDLELPEFLAQFKRNLMRMDISAFKSEENFWSVIVEQMETGLL